MNNEIVSALKSLSIDRDFFSFCDKHQFHDKKRALHDIFGLFPMICSIIIM